MKRLSEDPSRFSWRYAAAYTVYLLAAWVSFLLGVWPQRALICMAGMVIVGLVYEIHLFYSGRDRTGR